MSFSYLLTQDNQKIALTKIIDSSSFRMIGLKDDEKKHINNPYYLGGRMNCYYKDTINIYAFIDKENPEFLLLGLWRDVGLLGGNYLKVKDKIYSGGNIISNAHIATFHTMNIDQYHNKSEWSITIGLDKNYSYFNEKIMDMKTFNSVVGENNSLKAIYFND